jgi:hypothetical protein
MPEKKPIPTSALYPVAFACLVIVVLVLFGAPDLVLVPIAAITVLWVAVMVARHYLGKGA